jgi:hypothetical protein
MSEKTDNLEEYCTMLTCEKCGTTFPEFNEDMARIAEEKGVVCFLCYKHPEEPTNA